MKHCFPEKSLIPNHWDCINEIYELEIGGDTKVLVAR